jgi:TRAP-type C4-dicarboxylate transport system permease small subunit
MLPLLRKLDKLLDFSETALVIALLSTLLSVALVQVLARNFFSYSFSGADEIVRHSVLWLGFVGASLATRQKRHIKIDALSRFIPPSGRKITDIFINVIAAVICFFLFYASMSFVGIEKEFGDISNLFDIEVWYLEIIFPITFGICTLRFLLYSLEALVEVIWDMISRAV